LEEGFDVVYGTPEKEPHELWRGLASKLTKYALKRIMGVKAAQSVSAYRAFRTRLRAAFESYQSPFVSLDIAHLGHDPFCSGASPTPSPRRGQVKLHTEGFNISRFYFDDRF
jgi:hypothetical protein